MPRPEAADICVAPTTDRMEVLGVFVKVGRWRLKAADVGWVPYSVRQRLVVSGCSKPFIGQEKKNKAVRQGDARPLLLGNGGICR